MSNVIELGPFQFARKELRSYDKKECQHLRTELDDNGHIVRCMDCSERLDPYFVLRELTRRWGEVAEEINSKRQQFEELKAKELHLVAARVVERAWRNKAMVPMCPHCQEGIRPEDNFGGSAISAHIDQARRDRRAEAKRKAMLEREKRDQEWLANELAKGQ